MHKGVIEINQVPTVVETWGRWVEEKSTKNNEDIILCIPGNPGVTGYYREFLETIYNKLQCPVWILGHAGHQKISKHKNFKIPKLTGNEKLFNLQGQIDHQEEFFKKYVPANAKVHIIAHSIGSYITLNLLKNPDINSKVVKAYLLFPTIDNMAETPNGKFLTNIISYIVPIIIFLSWIFTFFPYRVQSFLIYLYFKLNSILTVNIPPTIDLIHPAVLNKVFFMAYEEMNVVKSLDADLLEPNINKIKLYYSTTDNWAPVSYYRRLIEKYPNINAELCVRKFSHAFVLRTSVDVGNMVAGWIEINK